MSHVALVSLVRTYNSTQHELYQAVLNSLSLIEYKFPKVNNIIIKPNMCYYWDSTTGQTTDPRFVGALIEAIYSQISRKANVSIVESDASAMKCRHVFKILGYEKIAREYNAKLINLSEDKSDPLKVTVGDQSFHLNIPRTIQEADLKINVTKIKYSLENIKITCALKNIFGCNPYPKKFRYHPKLDETIVALNKAMKFDLSIVDGIIVSGIQPRRLGLVMASTDSVAIDVAAAKIAGVNPKKIRYIQLAKKEGLGNMSYVEKGVPLSYFKDRYPRKNVRKILMGKAYNMLVRTNLGKSLGLD